MIRIMQGFSAVQNYKQLLRNCCLQNKVSPSLASALTLQKAATLYYQIQLMYEAEPERAKTEWLDNELRLFCWILICESHLAKKPISLFDLTDWQLVQSYFPLKPLLMLQYEYRKLLLKAEEGSFCQWDQVEKEQLSAIVSQRSQPYFWEDIARALYLACGKNQIKTSKQCREQWRNHLDPTKRHGQWQTGEDAQIMRFVLKNGHRWALLCKRAFPHRTEHMLKNRFNSILRKHKNGEMHSAASQKKLLKRIVKRLQEDITPVPSFTLTPHEACQSSRSYMFTANQVALRNQQNSADPNTPKKQLNQDFPSLLGESEINPLTSSIVINGANQTEATSSNSSYGYSALSSADLLGNHAAFICSFPMWSFYWPQQPQPQII